MIIHVKGNRYAFTETGPSRRFSETLTEGKAFPSRNALPSSITLTGTWIYGTTFFETRHKNSNAFVPTRLYTRGPRGHV